MTTLPHLISLGTMERQTGLTSLGVSMVNRFAPYFDLETAPCPWFVCTSQSMVAWTVQHRALQEDKAVTADDVIEGRGGKVFRPVSLVVIDDCDEYKLFKLRQLVAAISHRMQTVQAPCQIVLLRNPFNVKDLF